MSSLAAVFLYWAVVLVVVAEVRRELGGRRAAGRSLGRLPLLLHGAITVAVAGAVVLTVLRLRAGG